MEYINLKIPEHSYFFGFAQTDGTLNKTKNFQNKGRFQIEIGEKDKHILESFRKLFPSVYCGIRTRIRNTNFKENYKSLTFTVCSMIFRKELNKLGIPYGKKSSIISLPKAKFCERDYLRGLIDGDGSIGITKKGFPFISITVKSEELKNYLLRIIGRAVREEKRLVRNKRDNIYNIMLNREKAQKFIKYLYYPGCLSLKRKLKNARIALNWNRPKNIRRILDKKWWEKGEDNYIIRHSLTESCSFLKRTEGSVKMRLWRLANHSAPYLRACSNV